MADLISIDSKTGEIYIPTTDKFQSKPGETFTYEKNDLTERPGKHLLMLAEQENVTVKFKLPSSLLPATRKYRLSMRFQTDVAYEEPLMLEIKRGNNTESPTVLTVQIPLPNTNGEWEVMDPTAMDSIDLGGIHDTVLVFSHKLPKGMGIAIRDFTFILDSQIGTTGEYSIPWFFELSETLQKEVADTIIPKFDNDHVKAFHQTCEDYKVAYETYKKTKGSQKEAKAKAEEDLNNAMDVCKEAAGPIFEGSIDPALESIDFKSPEGKKLLQAIVLVHGTAIELGDYACQSPEKKQRLQEFLENPELMHTVLVYAGPRGGRYGRFLDIFEELEAKRQQGYTVLPKLALAVALELAEPLLAFHKEDEYRDPIERYFHYEQAYLNRELDPLFEFLSVWELRMAVNSDASNDELAWFRETIRNYRPQVAYMKDYKWRYVSIVKTDCYYQKFDRIDDYKQILSGGGKCGPRAWLGRFACKAFGNPTWGVRQPGHAAMSRWTPDGWMTVLGLGFKVSNWEQRDGTDFFAETEIRACLGDEQYFQKAGLVGWIAFLLGETQKDSCLHSENTWSSLAIVQRQRLSSVDLERKPMDIGQCEIMSRITEVKERPFGKERIEVGEDGSIIVPFSCRSSGSSDNGPFTLMSSFIDDGKQIAGRLGEITWELPAKLFHEQKRYKMSLLFVTVHETDVLPFLATITNSSGDNRRELELSFEMKWDTLGMWQQTEAVEVVLGGGNDDEILTLTRNEKKHPCTLKNIVFTPC
jgi:hypothetical protein